MPCQSTFGEVLSEQLNSMLHFLELFISSFNALSAQS